MKKNTILVITGPTAAGKSALAVALAHALGGEIVSADSMQVYRGMDIGTAKITPAEAEGVPHHMLDVAEPEEDFSVGRYVALAERCVEDILRRGKRPLLVGGTGLYIDALLAGTDFAAPPGDSGLREALSAEYDALGGTALWERLRSVDPDRAARLAPADKKRVLRALEVFALTGETITEHDARVRALPPRYPSVRFALTWNDRETLYRRIDRRVDRMLAQGLVREVEGLLRRGVPPTATAMQAIGYKEIAAALRGECTLEEAAETVRRESRRYAKRQLTWLRRDPGVHWLPREEFPELPSLLAQISFVLRQDPT